MAAFSYSIAHDLKAPLRTMAGFAQVLVQDYSDCLGETGRDYASRISNAARTMRQMIDDLLTYSQLTRSEILCHPLDPGAVLALVLRDTKTTDRDEVSLRPEVTSAIELYPEALDRKLKRSGARPIRCIYGSPDDAIELHSSPNTSDGNTPLQRHSWRLGAVSSQVEEVQDARPPHGQPRRCEFQGLAVPDRHLEE